MRKELIVVICLLFWMHASMAEAKYFSNLYKIDQDGMFDGSYSSVTVIQGSETLYAAGGEVFSESEGAYIPIVTIMAETGEPVTTLDLSPFFDEIRALDTFKGELENEVLVLGNKGSGCILLYFDATDPAAGATVISIGKKKSVLTGYDAKVIPYSADENHIALVGQFTDLSLDLTDYWISIVDRDGSFILEKRLKIGSGTANVFTEEAVALDLAPDTMVVVGNFVDPSSTVDPTTNIEIFELKYDGTFNWNVRFQSSSGAFFEDRAADIAYAFDASGKPINAVVTGWTEHTDGSWVGGGQDILVLTADIDPVSGLAYLDYAKQVTSNIDSDDEAGRAILVNSDNQAVIAGIGSPTSSCAEPDGLIAEFDVASGDFEFGRTYGEYNWHRQEKVDEFFGIARLEDDFVMVGANETITDVRYFSDSMGWLAHVKPNLRGGYVEPFSRIMEPYIDDVGWDYEFPCPLVELPLSADIEIENTSMSTFPTSRVPMPSGRTPGWMYNSDALFDIALLFRAYSGAPAGQNKWWKTYNGYKLTEHSIFSVTDNLWELVLGDDLNGDEITDLVWRHQSAGVDVVCYGKLTFGNWDLNACVLLPTQSDLDWQLRGSGDFDHDGDIDLVWRNKSTGDNSVWLMNGTTLSSTIALPAEPNINWDIAAVADVNSDGDPDIIWDRGTEVHVWQMNGFAIDATQFVFTKVLDIYIGAMGDINADGHVDFITRDNLGGNKVILMNGKSCPNWNIVSSYNTTSEPVTYWVMEGP